MRAYDGPELPPDQVAVVKTTGGLTDMARIADIDGRTGRGNVDTAEILPGPHSITIRISSGSGFIGDPQKFGDKTLLFTATAGHSYLIEGTIEDDTSYAWIVDEATNAVVAGEKP